MVQPAVPTKKWRPEGALRPAAVRARSLSGRGRGIDRLLGEFRQQLVGVLFLDERLLEERRRVVHPELLRPSEERAVARDLVVLDGLRRGDQAGVERLSAFELLGDLVAFRDDALD